MNERQQKAQALPRELGKLPGVWITSPMPLDDDRRLRFQVLDSQRDEVITTLCEWGWIPAQVQSFPRFTASGLLPACMFEITNMEKDRQPIADSGPKIPSEIAEAAKREEKVKAKEFIAAFRKSAGLEK